MNLPELVARALAAWYQAAVRVSPYPTRYPDPRASSVSVIDGLHYIVLRTATDDVVAVYRVVPANLTTPARLRLMKRPPAALTTS